jgi:hypothetical protein
MRALSLAVLQTSSCQILDGSKVAKPGNVAKQWPSKKISTYFAIAN